MNFKNYLKENKDFIMMTLFAIIVLSVFFFNQKKVQNNPPILAGNSLEKFIPDYNAVLNTIQAKSFYVYDILAQKSIFNKDEHVQLPLASITKLMSGLVALDVMKEDTIITIKRDDILMEGDSGLAIGEKWKLKDLLDFSLITSSNDGMHAIARSLDYYVAVNNKDTIKLMNEKAKNLGLNDTIFVNETGLDIDTNMSGAYSSSYDIAKLLEDIIKNNPSLIIGTKNQAKTFVSESNIKHIALNTDSSINNIAGMIASKTGFTDLAGGNLAIAFDAGIMHPVIVVVLGSTTDGRFSDVEKFVNLALYKLSE